MNPTSAELRLWGEWATNHVWASPEAENMLLAEEMWERDADVIRRVAGFVRERFPYQHLLTPPKLFHGFRHQNPKLKMLRKNEWLTVAGKPAPYRGFTESWSAACNYAHDQQAVAEHLARVRASGHKGATTDITYATDTMEPLGLEEPWGHGYVATLGRNFDVRSLLFHWRYFYEHHPAVVELLRDLTLMPRQPKRLADEKEWLFYCTHWEYLLDVSLLPNLNVQSYAACTKDRFFRIVNVEDTSAYVDSLMARQIPGPSPAFKMPWVP